MSFTSVFVYKCVKCHKVLDAYGALCDECLLKLKKEGTVKSFKMQFPYELQEKFTKNGKTYRAISYVADFVVVYNDFIEVVDTKGKETVEFKIKKKLFEYKYPELHLKIIQFYAKTSEWLELDDIRRLMRK